MGASNALAAYRLYPQLPATSMRVLAFMALVAKDRDEEPWWSQGHATLASQALGRPEPVTRQDEQADERAVRRAITPLFEAGAITTDRHPSGRGDHRVRVKYRLWLAKPAPDEKRRAEHRSQDGKRPVYNQAAQDGNRPARGVSIGRNPVEHRTKSGRAQDGNRPTKEYEEDEELLKDEEQTGDRRTPRTGSAPDLTAPWKIDFSDDTTTNPEDERRRQLDGLTALIRGQDGQLCPLCMCDPATPNGAASLAKCRQAACPLTAAAAS